MSSKSSVVKFGSLSAAVIAVINAPQVIAADAAEKNWKRFMSVQRVAKLRKCQ